MESGKNNNKGFFESSLGITVLILLVLCCCCLIVLAGQAGWAMYTNSQSRTTIPQIATATRLVTPTQNEPVPFQTPTPPALTATPQVTAMPVDPGALDSLKSLEESSVPAVDLYDLACRLMSKCNIPNTVPSGPFKNGDHQSFWVLNQDTAQNSQIAATLLYSTPHAYFWAQDGITVDQGLVKLLVDTFENKMYPIDRGFFGSEWTPGVDGDPHIYILYARGLGKHTGGYFSSSDEINPLAHPYSNAHEMFLFNADNSPLGNEYTYGTLAHEFQHMIHWNLDRNEDSWVNEGFSELAAELNGYTLGGVDQLFASNPDIQLDDWSPSSGANGPHYGAGFLFLDYFLDRFGRDAAQALVKDPLHGLESVDDTLKNINAIDKVTGKPINADDFFMDWAVANYLGDSSVGDGRYAYQNYSSAPKTEATQSISDCSIPYSGTVHQYGTDYLHFTCGGQHSLSFRGSTLTNLLPVSAFSGRYAFWSNMGDELDMTLTREFDFSSATGPLTLKYETWFDLEKNYDYAYLEASTDGGKSWQILKTPSGTDQNPSGDSYGWGYNGKSNGWLAETVDLSQYKGQKVLIRFEYVTDPEVNGDGMLVDDIAVPEINYFTDFEQDDGGWQAKGFARVENNLPQTFRLELINQNGQTSVQSIDIAPDQTAQLSVDLTDVTLVVSATTRFTRTPGQYTVTVK